MPIGNVPEELALGGGAGLHGDDLQGLVGFLRDVKETVEALEGGGGGGGSDSSQIVAVMRHGEGINHFGGGEFKVGPVVTLTGDGRWAKVEVHIPEFAITLPQQAGIHAAQGTIGIASPDLSVYHQDDYCLRFQADTTDQDFTEGTSAHVTALIPPWEGDIDIQISAWIGGTLNGRLGAQSDAGYEQQVEMIVTMFDTPSQVLPVNP